MLGGRLLIVALALLIVPVGPGVGQASGPVDAIELAGPVERPADGVLEPGLLDTIGDGIHGVIVQFAHEVPANLAEIPGIQPAYTFESLPAAYVLANAAGVHTLTQRLATVYVEDAWKPLAFDLDTSTLATLAREVWDPAADNPHVDGDLDPILADGEAPIDGSGVGIAVLDTGVDPTHPDFLATGKLARNFVATGNGLVEAPYFAPDDPHGTAVAGAAAGTGAASGGVNAGSAPGAPVYSFAVKHAFVTEPGFEGDAITLYPAVAMDWIAANGADQDPPIQIVNNAWHCRHPTCKATVGSETIHGQLAQALVDQDILVTWSFGNRVFSYNPEATLPIQGVVGVSSVEDLDLGLRNGCPAGEASVGEPMDPSTWPDVAAPGFQITAPAALTPDTLRGRVVSGGYDTLSATSLAAAQVAGTAALMLQANPDLSPAEIEWILEETATKPPHDLCDLPYNRGDPTHPDSEANHEVGHGLINAHAAVVMADGFNGIPDTDATAEQPSDAFLNPSDQTDFDTVDVAQRLYLSDGGALVDTRPTDDGGTAMEARSNEPLVFTSEPFDEDTVIGGIDASVWLSVDQEKISQWDFLADVDILLRVEQLGAGDVLKDAVTLSTEFTLSHASRALERPFVEVFDPAISVDADDRLRIHIDVGEGGVAGPGTELTSWTLHWGSETFPSHIGLGERAADAPDTYRGCREMAAWACAWIDIDHPSSSVLFDGGNYQLRWEGPGGSGAELLYRGATLDSCTIEDELAWGECNVILHSNANGLLGATECRVLDQPGPIQGSGTCFILDDR